MIGDRFSPILVKELRQGMRARAFEGSFLLLQVLMVLAIVVALLSVSAKRPGATYTPLGAGLFWGMVAIPVLLIMPIRGCNALRTEIDAKSLELIFLTRLSAWRIVAGKWAALFFQTCLLVIAVLPYAVVRYYLGSIDLVGDLVMIAGMLGASALLTAFTVSCSAFSSRLARSMVIIFPIVLLNVTPVLGIWSMAYRRSFGHTSHASAEVYLGFLFYGLVGLLYLLEIGSAQIAPPAENHAVRKRLLGVLILISGPVALWLGAPQEILFVNYFFLLVICFEAICVQWEPVPGAFLSLFRLKRIGRLLAFFFIPGWQSGVLYSIVVLGAFPPISLLAGSWDDEVFLACAASAGALFMPLAIVQLVAPRTRRLGVAYVAIQALTITATMIAYMLDEAFNLGIRGVLSAFPQATIILSLFGEADASWLPATLVVLLASLAVIFFRDVGSWRDLRNVRRSAIVLDQTGSASIPAPPDDAGA